MRLPRALLSAQVRARNALQSAFLHSESLLTQLLNREGGLSQVIRMQARHKHEPLDCSAGCLTCSTFLGDAEFKMPPWLKGGRQRGHLDLEMEPGSLQRSSPHRNWRHRLDPDMYMLQSTLNVQLAPAREDPQLRARKQDQKVPDGPEMSPNPWSSPGGPKACRSLLEIPRRPLWVVHGSLRRSFDTTS